MEIKLIQTQRALAATNISLADYVINPYRGCEFGCLYCYARRPDAPAVKINLPEVLEKELRAKRPRRVLLGSATECFQPLEQKYRLTRQALQILAKHKIPCTILTKSHRVADDLDILAVDPANKIYFTINFHSDSLIRALEKGSPDLSQRLEAVKKIIAAKIALRIHAGPYIPHLGDIENLLKLLPVGIKEINVELYHPAMGNFDQVREAVKPCVDRATAYRLKDSCGSADRYLAFGDELKNQLMKLAKASAIKIFYLRPEYDKFYSRPFDYAQPIF